MNTKPLKRNGATPPKAKLATTAADLMAERQGCLPVWIRAPVQGPEHFSGITRAKLYEWAGEGKIRSVSIRQPGAVQGVRLFHLQSILDFISRCEQESHAETGQGETEAK